MTSSVRVVALTLGGAAVFYALLEVVDAAQYGTFENPDPTLFARLWRVWSISAFLLPGILVVLLTRSRAPLLSAVAYSLGGVANYLYHYGEWEGQGKSFTDFLPRPHLWLNSLGGLFLYAAIGAIVGLVVVYLKRRLTSGWSDRGNTLR